MSSIPVIDFKLYGLDVLDPDSVSQDKLEDLGDQMCRALASVGFCYISNHGFPEQLIAETEKASLEFFRQPLSFKEKYSRSKSYNFGWVSLEEERINPERPAGDYKEFFNLTFEGSDQNWPETPNFEQAMNSMSEMSTKLAYRIFDVMSVGLNLQNKHFLRNCHLKMGKVGNYTTTRTLLYPAIPQEKDIKNGQIRCGEHSDYGTLTLLFQDNVGGLQVRTLDGKYIDATPIPNTIVVNIGDLMQRWTADRLIATKHRVVIPEEESIKRKDRQSIAFFVFPDENTIIECLDNSNKYEPVNANDYLTSKFQATYSY